MPPQQPETVQLSEAEAEQLRQYADSRGMTLDEASTQLAKQALTTRYVLRKTNAQVLPFRRPQ